MYPEYIVYWYLERGDEWRRRYFYTAAAAWDYARHNERMGFKSKITDVFGNRLDSGIEPAKPFNIRFTEV